MTDEVDETVEELSEEIILEENDEIDPILILEQQIEELQKEKQYNTAEIANIRQRYARERNILVKFAGMNLAFNILPVVDNLEKALEIENNDSEKFIEGVNLTLKRLKITLENEVGKRVVKMRKTVKGRGKDRPGRGQGGVRGGLLKY